jgi:PIN domain nuclease of toxin-antitoxin system
MYLLDTHVLIWAGLHPEKLGAQTQRLLVRSREFFFSPLSIAEIKIKEEKGQLKLPPSFYKALDNSLMTERPYLLRHGLEAARFPWLRNHDPVDRMLLSQASADELNFITADETLLALDLPWILDARL